MSATITNVYEFKGMNADDMKKAYRRLVKTLHPDVNKSDTATRDMQILTVEFSYWQAVAQRDFVYNTKVNEKPDSKDWYYKTYYSATFVNDLASAINFLIDNGIFTSDVLDVEIVGIFLWVYNIGKEDKSLHKIMSGANFHFKMKKDEVSGEYVGAWFYTPNYKRIHTNTTKQQNERKYGFSKVYGNRGLGSGD